MNEEPVEGPASVDPTPGPHTGAEVARYLRGEQGAFVGLWQRFRPALVALLLTRVRTALEPPLQSRFDDEIDDVLQDAAIEILAGMPGFTYRGAGSLLAFMSTIAVRTARDRIDYWRAGRRHPAKERPLAPPGGGDTTMTGMPRNELADPATGPSTAAALVERRHLLGAVLGQLDDRQQEIVALRFFCGETWGEIAESVGAPSGEAVAMECVRQIFPKIASALAAARSSAADRQSA